VDLTLEDVIMILFLLSTVISIIGTIMWGLFDKIQKWVMIERDTNQNKNDIEDGITNDNNSK
jgi:hypothetical protein